MRILLTGASGFIGRHLAPALRASGHTLVCAVRAPYPQPPAICDAYVQADFTRDLDVAGWLPKLRGIEAVINAVGILREQGSQSFTSLHVRAPCALFDACLQAGVGRVINISALGADDGARSAYHLSKRRADEHLAGLALSWTIVQPSLVYGPGGGSARLFNAMATAPLIPLPGGGKQLLQPIHVDDLVAGIVAALANTSTNGRVVAFVGATPLSLCDYLLELRTAMHLGAAHVLSIPGPWVRSAARVGQYLPGSLLSPETLTMLERGNTADPTDVAQLLGRRPRPVGDFISSNEAPGMRAEAQLAWLLPLLRLSLALVWIGTGVVSLGLYPTAFSYQLLSRAGVPAGLHSLFLYGAAALDLVLGIATLAMRKRRALWLGQIGLILLYTLIITVRLPEYWLHPYGPVLKNLPLLAILLTLYVLERR